MKIAKFGVEDWLNRWEAKATYDLSQSTVSSLSLEEIITIDGTDFQKFFVELKTKKMNYGDIEGSNAFKYQVSTLYQTMSAENILQTNGATGANLLAIFSIVEAGDHVISMMPTYQQLYELPKTLGAEVDFIKLEEKNNWNFPLDQLTQLIRSDTKLILLNSANNPTGTVIDKKMLNEIAKIAREVNAYVLVDEVYYPFEDTEWVSIVDIYEKGISTNSLSKTFSVPGIRIGWLAASETIIESFRKYRDYTMISSGIIDDAVAVHVLKNKNKILNRNQKIIEENYQILKNWVDKEEKITLRLPNKVSTSFVHIDVPLDTKTFCLKLLEETGVLLVPGDVYNYKESTFNHLVRLGYCCKKQTLIKGLEKISHFLNFEFSE